MKNKILFLIVIFALSSIYYSCSKDSTNPINSKPANYFVTNTYKKSTNKGIPNVDTLNITDIGSMVSLKFTLDTILNIDGNQKLDVVILHNGIVDTMIKSFTNPSFTSYNFQNVICTDTVNNTIQPGFQNYSGAYKPYKPLSVFNGQTLTGPWYLIINYPTLIRTGVIKSWGITVSYNTPTPPQSTIFPLAVGNYWVFSVDTGSVPNVFQTTLDINDQSTIRGKQVFKWQWQGDSRYWYFRNESDGMWWYGFYNGSYLDTSIAPFIWLKYPINVGESFLTKQFTSMGTDTITCLNLNSTFENFTGCVEYYGRSSSKLNNPILFDSPLYFKPVSNIYGNYYLKPSIGYVGNEVWYLVTGMYTKYKLIQYNVQ